MINRILEARENRIKHIESHLKNHPLVIAIKANMPGDDKQNNLSYLLIDVFHITLKKIYDDAVIEFHESIDGPYYLVYGFNDNPHDVKKLLILLEDSHPLGRFIDLDLYTHNVSVSRSTFRKCFICDQNAAICIRNRTHSTEELIDYMDDKTQVFLKDLLEESLMDAFIKELNVEPKFGLVTPFTSGSHDDMHYELMRSSIVVIIPYLVSMFSLGYTLELKEAFIKARIIGLEAEAEMYEKTGGVNTYKGAIFLTGIIVIALGRYYKYYPHKNLTSIIKEMTKDILDELNDNDTFGKQAYQLYNFYTARHEVHEGIPSVLSAYHFLKGKKMHQHNLLMTLIHIISLENDTVGLKRSGSLDNYLEIVKEISQIKVYDYRKIRAITKKCIEKNISFGGSADILIASVFLILIEQKLGKLKL